MSYTPPSALSVNFSAASSPYTPPQFNVVNFTGDGGIDPVVTVNGTLTLALAFAFSAAGAYDNAVDRYLQSTTSTAWQRAAAADREAAARYMVTLRVDSAVAAPWEPATDVALATRQPWSRRRTSLRGSAIPWRPANDVGIARRSHWEALRKGTSGRALPWSPATDIGTERTVRHQAMLMRRAAAGLPWAQAGDVSQSVETRSEGGRFVRSVAALPWQFYRQPPPGVRPPVIVNPEGPPCYIPPFGDMVDLVFEDDMLGLTDIIFSCLRGGIVNPETVVVPVRRVYMVFNEFSLVRWPDGTPIPATGLSMTLDADSWAWSFQATVQGVALPLMESTDGSPVTLRATINGSPFHWLAQSISRSRSFAQSTLNVSGRSVLSTLDAPNSPAIDYLQSEALTVRQLIDDVLSYNGVTLGVPVEFDLDDWLVPAKTFSHSGTYISAVAALAAAGGGYVQPHDTDLALRVRHRYPFMPRDWATLVTPDFILPSAVTTREGIEWSSRPNFNRIFLDGLHLAEITASGTAGDLPAPSVIEPLLTAPAGWLQRGRAEMAAGGRHARVNLSLPVLAETGIIRPGHWVSYVDGVETRLGLVRGVTVQVGMPTIMQNLDVETRIVE